MGRIPEQSMSTDEKEERLNQYMKEYRTSLIRMAYLYLGERATAEDVVQETFIKAYLHMDTFRGDMIQSAPLNLHIDSPYISQSGTIACGILDSACERYANGLLSMDMFLKELSEKMQMMYLENQ